MSDIMLEEQDPESSVRPSRPSLVQVKAMVEFIQKHPDLAHKKLRTGVARQKTKKLWIQVSNICNSLEGTRKSTKGWIKFWSDKRRSIVLKQRQIDSGNLQDQLCPIEQKIYDLCNIVEHSVPKRKRAVKVETCNGDDDDDSMGDLFPETEELDISQIDNRRLLSTEDEERQLNIMEKLVDVMDQQAQAMSQMAQATHSHSKSIERLAEASHIQALAVDRLASTFENINSAVLDVRNSMISVDYTMKRFYTNSATHPRQNSNLFS